MRGSKVPVYMADCELAMEYSGPYIQLRDCVKKVCPMLVYNSYGRWC